MLDVAAVRAERDRVGALLRALEPDAVALTDAEAMWSAFDRIERHAANAKTLLARRVEEAAAWRQRGHRDAAEGMAKQSGTTRGAAKKQLDLSKQLDAHPATETAMRKGEISPTQAAIVANGANGNAAAEQRLLDKAMTSTVAALRQEAARERAARIPIPRRRNGASIGSGGPACGPTKKAAGTSTRRGRSVTAATSNASWSGS
jgi:hypothetical protein